MAAKLGNGKTWVPNAVYCFLLFSVPMTIAGRDAVISTTTDSGRDGSSSQRLEVQKLLKNLNKPAVKSIKSPDGDIIDCVYISNQPAFDHPMLKNHKIQMRPNFHPLEQSKVSSKSKPIPQLWHKSGSCPEGTIPIRRTRKDDILRASSIQQFGKKKHKTIPQFRSFEIDQINHQYAVAYVKGDKYYGAQAIMNVWKPNVQEPNEFSLSQFWVLSGAASKDLNSIEAGWQVSAQLYGDNNTRLFTYWTSDSYQDTGCYNLLCSGFIQLDNGIAVGASIDPLSVYGDSQYDITIVIWKDPNDGNWWMQYGIDKLVGYWPGSLFSHLSDGASAIQWGGEVLNTALDGQHTTTQMGSGHFAEEGFGKASFFRNIKIVNGNYELEPPNTTIGTYADLPNCYNIQNGYSDDWGNYFYYGGPGRNPNCP